MPGMLQMGSLGAGDGSGGGGGSCSPAASAALPLAAPSAAMLQGFGGDGSSFGCGGYVQPPLPPPGHGTPDFSSGGGASQGWRPVEGPPPVAFVSAGASFSGSCSGGGGDQHREMLAGLVQALQGQPEGVQIPPHLWRHMLVLLLAQLRLKRQRASLEETLTEHTLRLIMKMMPRAVPELATPFGVFCSPLSQESMLQMSDLRRGIEEHVLQGGAEQTEALSKLFATLFQTSVLSGAVFRQGGDSWNVLA